MSEVDNQIIEEFQVESKNLIDELNRILEKCEESYSQVGSLENYGQTVDRIMGGAKSLGVMISDQSHSIHQIGDYSALCKAVGYKASQIKNNEDFYNICVALLQDATEIMEEMIEGLNTAEGKNVKVKSLLSKTFLDRLKWVSDKFGSEYRASVDIHKGQKKMNQGEIDELLKKLGLD